MHADVAAQLSKVLTMALKVINGIGKTKAEATVISIAEGVIWFTPTHGGRLKCPLRLMPDAVVGAQVKYVQVGSTVQRLERV